MSGGGFLSTGAHVPDRAFSQRGRPGGLLRVVVSCVVVLLAFVAAGAGAGWLWHHLWTAPAGEAVQGTWYPLDETSLGGMFDATGLFVLIGAAAGLVLGVLAALLVRRGELLCLVTVVVGAVLATWLCYRIGLHLSPPDPATVAAHAADYTHVPGAMSVPGHSPFVSWVFGALLGLGGTYVTTSARGQVAAEVERRDEAQQWLNRDPTG